MTQEFIAALLAPDEYRWISSIPGTPLTLTYGFMTVMPAYAGPPYEFGGFQAFTSTQQQAVHRAVQLFEEICNVDFVFRADGDAAAVRFGAAILDDWEAAHTYYPYPNPAADWAGDVWFNTQEPSVYTQTPGSYGFMVTLHEMGHALGLKHPFDTGEGGATLPSDKDSRQYTVMSYYSHPTSGVEPASLLLYDIAALQYLYGANWSTRSGDTTYQWSANEQFIYCIWDGGGTDTIDASNQTRRVVINLNPGTFSSVGANGSGDALNNLSIAFNVSIENAKGGSGNDIFYASQVANTITGNGGWDLVSYKYANGAVTLDFSTNVHTGYAAGDVFASIEAIEGSDWNDTFIGGSFAGSMQLRGGFGYDTLIASSGVDRFDGGEGNDTVSYENSTAAVTVRLDLGTASGGFAAGDILTSVENVTGSDFNDTLIGNGWANVLIGGLGDDYLDGRGGADHLEGGLGNDTYVLNAADTVITIIERENEGIDTIRTDRTTFHQIWNFENIIYTGTSNFYGVGNFAANRIEGGIGDDTLIGQGGGDTLIGGVGNDLLEGGEGADVLDGGAGFDWATYANAAVGFVGVTVDMVDSSLSTGHAAGDTFIGIEGIIGATYGDTLRGDGANNTFRGQGGSDTIDGRGGYDTAIYFGASKDYEIMVDGTVTTIRALRSSIAAVDGTDVLIDIENIQFLGSVNHAPTVNWISSTPLRGFRSSFLSQLSLSDADGDQVQYFEIRDTTDGAGYFILDGVQVAAGQLIALPMGADARLQYQAGSALSDIDRIQIRVSDGVDWGAWQTLSVGPTNSKPVVAVNQQQQTQSRGTYSLAAASLMTGAYDSDRDPIIAYEFHDRSEGKGYFTINGVAQGNSPFVVSADSLDNVRFVIGGSQYTNDVDVVWIRAYDGYEWGLWSSMGVGAVKNAAPSASASNAIIPSGTYFAAASDLFSVSDADGDAMVLYEFRDNTAGGGYFRLNGAGQGSQFQVSASQLPGLEFVAGPSGGVDQLSVRVNDGYAWSAWTSFTVTTRANAAPIAIASDKMISHGTSAVAASGLFSIADPDGDTIKRYRIYDGTIGNGTFQFDGTPVPERKNFEIGADDLAKLRFRAGAPGSKDVLWVQASDGMAWGAWTTFTVTSPANSLPVITVNTAALSPTKGTVSIAADDLFDVADADGDPITQYRFYDGTLGNGRFYLNGEVQIEQRNIEITQAELADFEYRTSTAGGDTLWIQAYDGFAWGAWKSFNVAAPANVAPVVNVQNLTPAHGVTAIAAANLFTLTDPDDANTALAYRFYDGTLGNGRFWLNGDAQIEQRNIEITQAQLADLEYRTSPTGTGDMLWIQAFDGVAWSAWKSFTVAAPVNTAPVVNVQPLAPAHGVTRIAGDQLYTSITDADGDPITRCRFYDGTLGNGRYYLSGTAQVEQRNIEITAAELADFEYRTSATGSDVLWVQVFDGTSWSAWKSYTVAAVPNAAPVVTVQNLVPTAGQTAIAGNALYTSITDADGDPITRYRFYDGTIGNGRFWLNGDAQIEQRNIEIAAADLANFEYRTSTGGGDTLWVQAYDGYAWSDWKSFSVAARPAAMASSSVDMMASQIAAAQSMTSSLSTSSDDTSLWREQRLHTILLAPG